MKTTNLGFTGALAWSGLIAFASASIAQTTAAAKPYKIINTAQIMGTGGIDYVYADNEGGRLYIPRGGEILVFDLGTLKQAGTIPNARARGVAIDPKSHHGFSSSSPVVMWDTATLKTIKTIDVQGRPDGIHFEPATERVYVLSHSAPNATVIDAKDGTVVGTIDLGGAPEQAASDRQGHLYVAIEDKDNIAVVDVKTLKVTAHYGLEGKGGGPAGLGMDVKNRILFAMCHEPATCVILGADDGKILATLPIGNGTDGGGFNPSTMEAFSSQRDGTLTIIKENSPTSFEVAQTVRTKTGAKTCTLDTKNNQIILITTEAAPAVPPTVTSSANVTPTTAPSTATAATPAGADQPGGGRRGGRGGGGPSLLDILVVGR